MSKEEVQNLSDEDLKSDWEQVKAAFRRNLQSQISGNQFNILFANFVNISNEMNKRKLDLKL